MSELSDKAAKLLSEFLIHTKDSTGLTLCDEDGNLINEDELAFIFGAFYQQLITIFPELR